MLPKIPIQIASVIEMKMHLALWSLISILHYGCPKGWSKQKEDFFF